MLYWILVGLYVASWVGIVGLYVWSSLKDLTDDYECGRFDPSDTDTKELDHEDVH